MIWGSLFSSSEEKASSDSVKDDWLDLLFRDFDLEPYELEFELDFEEDEDEELEDDVWSLSNVSSFSSIS